MRRKLQGRLSHLSLQARFGLLVGGILVLIIALVGILIHASDKAALRSLLRERAQVQLSLLEQAAASALFNDDLNLLDPYEDQFARDQDVMHVLVLDRTNEPILEIGEPPPADYPTVSLTREIQVGSEILGEARLVLSTEKADQGALLALRPLAVIGIIALLLLVTATILIFRHLVARPIGDLTAVAAVVAAGDLTQPPARVTTDEIGRLAGAFGTMIESLRRLVTEIRSAADQVAGAATEVAATSEESARTGEATASRAEEVAVVVHQVSANTAAVAKNAEVQSGVVTQTSAAVEEIAAAIGQVADSSHQLVTLAEHAGQAVGEGRGAVTEAVTSLEEVSAAMGASAATIRALGAKAENIDQIVEVIDDLAEQTNLLALNAAIEAARAGEHGLGFAVVAEEVRKLAERSAQSTKEIGALVTGIQGETQRAVDQVERSVTRMSDCVRLSTRARESLSAIDKGVGEVTHHAQTIGQATAAQHQRAAEMTRAGQRLAAITAEITHATAEQAEGTAQAAQDIEQIREAVHQNSAGTAALAASAEELAHQAEALQEAVKQFAVSNGQDQ
ncbi:MAG: methyl-accepting chemotaxis protein [Candidatus Methylomirabilales bacterium]